MPSSGETRASLGGGERGDEAYCATCSRSYSIEATHCPHDGSRLVRFRATEDSMIGKVLDGRYEIRKPLGEGGMGTVYRGFQLSVEREVAIKVVHPSIATEREAAKRFLREAKLASRLSAPGIVQVFDFGQSEDGVLYLVMELLKGQTLGSVLKACGTLPPARVVTIALQLCDALESAHSLGIVHRDLKPGNVIVADDTGGRDLVKVLDFGLAKSIGGDSMSGITNTHALMGTPLYMAPEQISGSAIDQRADLYALGCMLHELLVGTPPFVDQQITALLSKHLTEPPPPLPSHIPRSLAAVIERLLAKQPADRYASAAELRDVLHQVAAGTPSGGIPIIRPSSSAIGRSPYESAIAIGPTTAQAAYVPHAAVTQSPPPQRSSSGRRLAVIGLVAVLITGGGVLALQLGNDRDAASTPADAAVLATPIDASETIATPPLDAHAAAVPPADAIVPEPVIDAAAPIVKPPPKKRPKQRPKPSTSGGDDELPFVVPR